MDPGIPAGPDGGALKVAMDRFPALPVLLMTAHEGARKYAPRLPCFSKPLDTGKLLAAVENLWRWSSSSV